MPETIEHIPPQPGVANETQLLHAVRSEEVQEIMGRMPSWITRWGITVMAVVFAGVFAGSHFFKYPDMIPARVTISAASPPVKIVARSNLPIGRIFVTNNSEVSAGQVLGILANTADYDQVEHMALLCTQIDTAVDLRSAVLHTRVPVMLSLGELQGQYIALLQALQEYQFFIAHNSYDHKMGQLAAQSGYQLKLSGELRKKDNHLKEQFHIQQQRFHADSILVAEQVMSKVEYENARKDLLSQQMNAEGNYTTILQSQLQEKEIQKSISETEIELQTKENAFQQRIREAAKQFKGAYAQWAQNYVLRTPVAGTVSFFKFWKENQFVQAGEAVMMVAPSVQEYVARGELSVSGAGKVKAGQKVLIRLTAYPYEEFGSLSGTLQSRSPVAMDSTFAIEIKLDRRLATNAGQVIPDQPQLIGMAEIITENKSVLQRLFESVYGKRRR